VERGGDDEDDDNDDDDDDNNNNNNNNVSRTNYVLGSSQNTELNFLLIILIFLS
jgi:hypothetical protein